MASVSRRRLSAALAQRWQGVVLRQARYMFSVPVSLQPSFTAGAPVRLFSNAAVEWQYWNATYDVSCDGWRFVLIEPHGPTLKASIRIVENWIAEFRGGADPN